MSRSQQTFSKREKEKKRLKKREEKQKKKEARKAESKQNDDGIPFAYVDNYGNLTETPPETDEQEEIDASEIVLGIPKKDESDEENDPVRNGKVAFFNHNKGYGFITDSENQEKYFCHISEINDEINEGNKVSFEIEKGARGLNAVRVNRID